MQRNKDKQNQNRMAEIAYYFLDDIFKTYREKQYTKEVNDKLSSFGKDYEKLATPNQLNISMYKLHISVGGFDYSANKEVILGVLIKYLNPQEVACFKEFKFLKTKIAKKKIEQKKELIAWLHAYKLYLGNKKTPFNFPAFKKSLAVVLNKPIKEVKGKDYPKAQDIDKNIEDLEFCISTQRRFFYGDQFTIYLPKDFSLEKVWGLCKEINEALESQRVEEGSHSDVVGRIGKYVSLRQEYSALDYEEMERSGIIIPDKRIDAVQEIHTAEENARRVAIKEEIINSEFYKYLSSNMMLNCHPTMFYQPTQQVVIDTKELESISANNVNLTSKIH